MKDIKCVFSRVEKMKEDTRAKIIQENIENRVEKSDIPRFRQDYKITY